MAQQHINVSTPNDGLGDTLRTSQVKAESNFNELYANKVDKVIGKVLSDTNYTQAEKDKLAGLASGGQVQSDMLEGNSALPSFIKNKFTKTSDFTNDGNGIQAYVPDVGAVGVYARSAGEWIEVGNVISTITSKRYAGYGQTYTLPTGAIAFQASINDYPQWPEEVGFESDLNTFTQIGTTLTFKETIETDSRIRIMYYF